jgi:two-component system chemotaxis response regulator CheB
MPTKDIVVIGASAGGVEALISLVSRLPADFSGSVFVVVHVPADTASMLPQILTRRGPLVASHPKDGESIQKGRIYVAPPDFHLILEGNRVRLVRGPKEHGVRPAVDPLFRSAALEFGPRVVGVILSGNLDDGSGGIIAIKERGGTTIVQDPSEALYPGMINSAVATEMVDYCLPISEIATQLHQLLLSGTTKGAEPMTARDDDIQEEKRELAIDKLDFGQLHGDNQPGVVSTLTCPECNGALWELTTGGTLRYRCRVGHAYAVESLLSEQKSAIEAAFWMALRALEERGAFLRRLADRARQIGSDQSRTRYTDEEKLVAERAKTLRDVILSGILTNEHSETTLQH